jgi:hypothetical protein
MTQYMMHYALNITLVAICGAYILTALALWASEELLRPHGMNSAYRGRSRPTRHGVDVSGRSGVFKKIPISQEKFSANA